MTLGIMEARVTEVQVSMKSRASSALSAIPEKQVSYADMVFLAIAAAREKYGRLCQSIAENIVGSREDAEECVNDTLFKPHKNDAKTVGEEKFREFVFTDYFEAFEFKNRKNEVFNKSFLNIQDMTEDIRFITGSDCHDWRYYPFDPPFT